MTTVFCAVIRVLPSLCHVPPSWKAGYSPSVLVAPSFHASNPGRLFISPGARSMIFCGSTFPLNFESNATMLGVYSAPSGPVYVIAPYAHSGVSSPAGSQPSGMGRSIVGEPHQAHSGGDGDDADDGSQGAVVQKLSYAV